MVMFFEDLADDVLLAVLQETPLASRILRLTLVSRRLHHLVGESLRRTRSLAIVFPRKAKNSSRKLPPSSSSPDRRLAYFRQNYRLKVLPKSAHLNFCPHHHLTKRSFPANHLLNLFPQLTTLQLVHPPLGDSRHHFHQLIAFLRGLSKTDHLRHLSIFFLCTSSKASEQAVLGRLEQLIRAAAQSGGSKHQRFRSLTLTFDLTHQLMDPAVWEFDDEGVRRRNGISNSKGKSGPTFPLPPPLDLSNLQELTVLFAGDYYFAEVKQVLFCQFKKILKFCLFLFI